MSKSAGNELRIVGGLNPCSNGICSMREKKYEDVLDENGVLILVLMEYVL